MRDAGHTILTPLISLDTPGKATVEVVIPADPVSGYVVELFKVESALLIITHETFCGIF